ncbi:cadherin-87A isoform X2 [Phymastichus coffea]|uniref:cadherin-87A isoform X2 n=1 Tax=Phymastichus coffea TaxID=108790 RepID=UPI00273B4440|nr:cadherin-87A isoform X2 [Phymastichus coffea]
MDNKPAQLKNWFTIIRRSVLGSLLLAVCTAGSGNVNEPPTFETGGYPVGKILSEATPVGSEVFRLKGHDPEGSLVKYGIQLNEKFIVDERTGLMTLAKPLDREELDTIRFRVTLEDSVPLDQQPNIVGVEAYVIVLDENDNPPQFLEIPYEAIVDEDTPPGTTILPTIRVIDPDLIGENIQLTCVPLLQFPDACSKFSIVDLNKNQDSYIGALVLNQSLDYKERAFYQFLLQASDGINTNTTDVEIKVGDIQNSPPEFLGSLIGIIKEDDPIGTLVMTVKARDGDRGMPRKIIYELVTNPFDYFLLDAESGEIYTAKPLDREALENSTGVLTFDLRARELIDDQPGNDSSSTFIAKATITIKDVNDEPPTFNRKEYNVVIPENIANGTLLPHLGMIVRDPDMGLNSMFSLRLDDITGAFTIEPGHAVGSTSVNIRVNNSSLDYEDPNQRKFIILVVAEEIYTKTRLSSTATVTIGLTDINDNAPLFSSFSYTAQISETAKSGTSIITIAAKDRDSGRFGTAGIVYELIGRGSEHFITDTMSGTIFVAPCLTPGVSPCLDYEERTEYFLDYKATDDHGKGQITTVPLRLDLTDANDSPPKFIQSNWRAVIDEGADVFEPPLRIQACDPDKSSKIHYLIVEGNDLGVFKVDPTTGEITIVKHNLLTATTNVSDDVLTLTVQASDGTFADEAVISITVRDVNNNAPRFAHDFYTASISELSAPGNIVEELSATDADSGLNAQLVYRIQKGGFNDFVINKTNGAVYISRMLDYDQQSVYHLEIIASDQGSPSLTGTTTLMISVENSNDKPPFFEPEVQRAEVTEDTPIGTVIALLQASDPDIGNPEALNFAISEPITAINRHGQPLSNKTSANFKYCFAVDKKTGQVSVIQKLNRNVAATISLPLLVSDTSASTFQQGKGYLIVTIIDVNHFPPEFNSPWTHQQPRYSIEMQEEQPIGAIVGAFTATDVDNNIASYAIEPPSPYFHINNVTGIVRTSQIIDYEETKQLQFTVVAYDTGVPQLVSKANISVMIVNINDEDPKFEQDFYNTTIKENSPPGTRITVVKAYDADDGSFGEVTYSLIGDHVADFNIDHETGEITVAAATVLDREFIPEITVSVMANDKAPLSSRRSTSTRVVIRLIDVNDNRPIFTQHSYRASVAENLSVNPPAPILQVSAIDPDEGINGAVWYKIIKGNDNDSFTLNPETGILYPALSLLDRAQSYQIKVEARDVAGKGLHSDTCNIYIRVITVNQHKPQFIIPELPNTTVEVPENDEEPSYLVMTIKAIDKDSGDNGKVSYHMKVGNRNVQETEEFSINQETGELRSKIILDRETKNKFEIVLVAADHGTPTAYETLRLLTIVLIDANDNAPEFFEEYHYSVPENHLKNYYIGKVTAEDKDEGKNAKVYYYIKSGNKNKSFYINKSDGSIYTNCSFDREQYDSYLLTILAANDPDLYIETKDFDHLRKNPEHGYVNVTIKILDENDNPPIFQQSTYYAGVNTVANINELVTKITASDADLGENGTLQFYVASANLYKHGSYSSSGSIVPSPFNITHDGKLVTSSYMAEYNQDRFIIEIVAKEIASPERFVIAKVYIWIFEPRQLIRVIVSRSPEEVNRNKDEIILKLSNATRNKVVVDDIRYHVDSSGHIRREWCDIYLHVVDTKTQTISPIPQVLKIIDSKYNFLKDYYTGLAIENVIPAYIGVQEDSFDIALVALVALMMVLLIGIVTIIIVCCYFKHWVVRFPNDISKKDGLIKQQIIDELNTTENPLWIEQDRLQRIQFYTKHTVASIGKCLL